MAGNNLANNIRWWLRKNAPEPLRRQFAILRRAMADIASPHGPIATQRAARADKSFVPRISARQDVRQTEHAAGKIENLRLAAARLTNVTVAPGEVFSFWTLIGPPTRANGFHVGRSIVQDRLVAEVGGGLCQISGLAYELALRAGLTIIERFPHSRDLYTEETRFTPLGLDATVVHGFKDLRFCNDGAAPIAFEFLVETTQICGALTSPAQIMEWQVEITRSESPDGRRGARVCRTDPQGGVHDVSMTLYVVDAA